MENRPAKSRTIIMYLLLAATGAMIGYYVFHPGNDQLPEEPLVPTIRIAKETTYITEPLLECGYPDYVGYLNHLPPYIPPRENAAAQLFLLLEPQYSLYYEKWEDITPEDTMEKLHKVADSLHVELPDEKNNVFVTRNEFTEKYYPEYLPDENGNKVFIEHAPIIELMFDHSNPIKGYRTINANARWFAENAPFFDRLIEISYLKEIKIPYTVEHEYAPYYPSQPSGNFRFYWGDLFSKAVRELQNRCRFRLHTGDIEGSIEDSLAMFRLARLFQKSNIASFSSTSDTISNEARYEFHYIAANKATTSDQIKSMLKEINVPPAPLDKQYLEHIRLQVLALIILSKEINAEDAKDLFQDMRYKEKYDREIEENPDFGIYVPPSEFFLTARNLGPVNWNRLLIETNDEFDEAVKALSEMEPADPDYYSNACRMTHLSMHKFADDDPYDLYYSFRNDVKEGNPIQDIYRKKNQQVFKSFVYNNYTYGLIHTIESLGQSISDSLMILALVAYHLDHGCYPKSHHELIPDYLDRLPSEYDDDIPMDYSIKNRGLTYTISHGKYSVSASREIRLVATYRINTDTGTIESVTDESEVILKEP